MKNQSAENDFPFCGKRFFILSRLILCFEEGVWRGSSDILKTYRTDVRSMPEPGSIHFLDFLFLISSETETEVQG